MGSANDRATKTRSADRADEIVRQLEPFDRIARNQSLRVVHRIGRSAVLIAGIPFLVAVASIVASVLTRVTNLSWGVAALGTLVALLVVATAFVPPWLESLVRMITRPRSLDRKALALAGDLRSVRDVETSLFSGHHVHAMGKALVHIADPRSPTFDVELAYLLIETLEKVGNAETLQHLDMLCRPPQEERLPESLHGAAERASHSIRARLERERSGQTLLRAADDFQGEGLLRPAQGAEETAVDLLLRPTSGTNGTPD